MNIFLDILRNQEIISGSEQDLLRGTFILLLMLPIITTVTGFFRHIVGLKSISLYAPVILTFAFYELGLIELIEDDAISSEFNFFRGLKFGLAIYFIVIASSAVMYRLLRAIRMHYIPKSSITLIGVTVTLIVSIFIGTLLSEKRGLIYLDIFSIVMVATLSETLVSMMSRKDLKYTFTIAIQTLITALVSYALISLNIVQDFSLVYTPLLIILLLIINFYIGSYTGLRLTEFLRFRDILLDDSSGNVSKTDSNKKK